MARDLHARDSTIREIAEKLSETAKAAVDAAFAAHTMDKRRRIACVVIEWMKKESEKLMESSKPKVMTNCHPPMGFVYLFATFCISIYDIFFRKILHSHKRCNIILPLYMFSLFSFIIYCHLLSNVIYLTD